MILELIENFDKLSINELKNILKEENAIIVKYKKDEIILLEDEDIKYIDYLAKGSVYISSFLEDGQRVVADKLESPQYFSLLEILNDRKRTLSSVIALTDVIIIRIAINRFMNEIYKNHKLMKNCFEYLSKFTISVLEENKLKSSYTTQKNILNYFYYMASDEKLPISIKLNKSFIADLFNVNVRTIYRYLKIWEEEGFLKRQKQNIIIDEIALKKILREIQE